MLDSKFNLSKCWLLKLYIFIYQIKLSLYDNINIGKNVKKSGECNKKYGGLTVFLGLFEGIYLFVVFVEILQVLKGEFLFFNQFQDFANSIQIIS